MVFQSGFYAYLLNSVVGPDVVVQIFYRSTLIAGCVLAAITFSMRWRALVHALWPVYAVLFCIAAIAPFYDGGSATRSMMTASALIGVTATLMAGGRYTPIVMQVMTLAIVGLIVHLFLELFAPGVFSTTPGRAAGLHQNPNLTGVILGLAASVVLSFVDRRWSGAIVVLVMAGLLATISRSAIVVFVVALCLTVAFQFFRDKQVWLATVRDQRWRNATLAAFVVCASVFGFALKDNVKVLLAYSGSARTALIPGSTMGALTKAIREENAVEIARELGTSDSGAARIVLLRNAARVFALAPWTGVGPVRAHNLAPHNQYAYFALSFGIVGLILGAALVAAIFYVSKILDYVPARVCWRPDVHT